ISPLEQPTPRITRRRHGGRNSKASSTPGGTPSAQRPTRGSCRWGSFRPAPNPRRGRARAKAGAHPPATKKRPYAGLLTTCADHLAFADHECGRLLDTVRALPDADNTLIFYIVGDNGASSEGGMSGTVNEVMNLNGVASRLEDNLKLLDKIGDPDTEPHYPLG